MLDSDGYIAAAVVFYDEKPLSSSLEKRLLYSIKLTNNGDWVGSDGESMTVDHGRLTPASAFKAVRSALAQKLQMDTDFVEAVAVAS